MGNLSCISGPSFSRRLSPEVSFMIIFLQVCLMFLLFGRGPEVIGKASGGVPWALENLLILIGGSCGAKHSPPTSPLGRPTGKIGVSTQIGNFSTVSSPSSSRKLSLTVSFVIIFRHVFLMFLVFAQGPEVIGKVSAGSPGWPRFTSVW